MTSSDYLDSSNEPLEIRVEVKHQGTANEDEHVLDEFIWTNIQNGIQFTRRMPPSAAATRYMSPLVMTMYRQGASTYRGLNHVLVTLRFRKKVV